jgi:DNA-binding winged helix-turn-helix (wHTH) protein
MSRAGWCLFRVLANAVISVRQPAQNLDIATRDNGVFGFGPFLLDPLRRRLTLDGEVVKLPATQFDTLLFLVQNPGWVVEKDELLAAVWGGRIVEESNLSQAIYLLRRALARGEGGEGYILTAPGRGYRFSADVHEVRCIPPHSASRATATAPAIDASVEGFAASQATRTRRRRVGGVLPPWQSLAFSWGWLRYRQCCGVARRKRRQPFRGRRRLTHHRTPSLF